MSLRSCCVTSSAITSQHREIVLLDNWRALIDDNISSLFKKSWHKEAVASMKASFIISPSWKDLLCKMTEWLTSNNDLVVAFACEFRCVKNDCCPINCDFSPFTFLFHSSQGSQCRTFYEKFKVPLNISLLRNSDGSWQIRQMHFKKRQCPPPILHVSGFSTWFSLPTHFLYPFFCWYRLKPLTRSLSSLEFCSS